MFLVETMSRGMPLRIGLHWHAQDTSNGMGLQGGEKQHKVEEHDSDSKGGKKVSEWHHERNYRVIFRLCVQQVAFASPPQKASAKSSICELPAAASIF